MHKRSPFNFQKLQEIIITALNCERYAQSEWACTQLETLLRNICTENEKKWATEWSAMDLPEGTRRVIRNVAMSL